MARKTRKNPETAAERKAEAYALEVETIRQLEVVTGPWLSPEDTEAFLNRMIRESKATSCGK